METPGRRPTDSAAFTTGISAGFTVNAALALAAAVFAVAAIRSGTQTPTVVSSTRA